MLIVDDDRATRDLLRDQLSEAGHRVRTAADGAEALERMATERPQLMLFDLSMPTMDGWELRRRMLERHALASIPSIALTGEANPDVSRLGVDRLVHKPIDTDELLELVERVAGPPS
ncbi:MAG TPA: response regulator [Candidatus Limnocylindria bacterium]|nr:response regulator [Candidatus Limnocylindria bacterium]